MLLVSYWDKAAAMRPDILPAAAAAALHYAPKLHRFSEIVLSDSASVRAHGGNLPGVGVRRLVSELVHDSERRDCRRVIPDKASVCEVCQRSLDAHEAMLHSAAVFVVAAVQQLVLVQRQVIL